MIESVRRTAKWYGAATQWTGLLVMVEGVVAGWEPRALFREVPWTLFPLLVGLLLLVSGAERVGLVAPLVQMAEGSAHLCSSRGVAVGRRSLRVAVVERLCTTSEALIYAAMGRLMLRRLARN